MQFSCDVSRTLQTDVLVCGGGPAGVAAAIAASRRGTKTMLVESQGSLGGVATHCLVGVWLGSYSRDGRDPVIGGLFSEIVERLVAENAAIPARDDVPSGTRHLGYASWHGRSVPFEFEPCKRILEEMVIESGVDVRYFTTAVAPHVEDNCIQGVFLHSKSGMEYVQAAVVIDTTGDADIAYRAGCPVVIGREDDGLTSPTGIILVFMNVDYAAFQKYCLDTGDIRLKHRINELRQQKRWPLPFDGIVCCEMPRRGMYFINGLQQVGINGTSAVDLTRGIIQGRRQASQLTDIMKKYILGFAHAELVQTSPMLGVRDTRRIVGHYHITVDDVIVSRRYNDTIALSGYQWDMSDPKTMTQEMHKVPIARPYTEIPYHALVPKNITNMIVAGRCLSCDWQTLGVLRIMPACFAMGHAAGLAATLVANHGCSFTEVDTGLLRRMLLDERAILQVEL